MIKQDLRKLIALLSAFALVLAASFPAMAGGDESIFEGMTPGEYKMTSVRFEVPSPADELGLTGMTSTLSGADVDEYGVLLMEQGKTYDFTWEQTLPAGQSTVYGVSMQPQVGYYPLEYINEALIPIDGESMFGFQTEGADTKIKVTFDKVALNSNLTVYGDGYGYGPTMCLTGKITIEVTTSIDGYFSIDLPAAQVGDDFTIANIDEISTILYEMETAARGDSSRGTRFDSPQEITYRIDLDGRLVGYGASPAQDDLNIGFAVIGDHHYTVQFQNKTYTTYVRDDKRTNGDVDFNTYSMDGKMIVHATSWTFEPTEELQDEPLPTSTGTVTAAEALTVTAGAGAVALGGSALVNVLGDTVRTTAYAYTVPDISDSVAGNTELPAADLPATAKKKTIDHKEYEEEPTSSGDGDSPDAATEANDVVPDLPEEDSPEVSMSLEAPGEDILNIKGGAVDITVEIEGGEGYTWHYIPAVITPGAAKAIIPTVIGHSNLTTLVLNITGAKTEERHHTVFVNVVAWTTTPDGKILKTSASQEMKLHAQGLEAKRDKDGKLTVTAYCDTTLKGYAEIRKLAAEEYTCTEAEDGTLTIQDVDAKLGSTVLKPAK